MTELIKHPEFGEIRTQIIKGEPIFCAADICAALGFSAAPEVALRKLDDDERLMRKLYAPGRSNEKGSLNRPILGEELEKGVQKMSAPGQHREMWFVNESGLYSLILRSRVPAAKKFRKWVTSEVLPSIRRTGYYVHPELADRKEERRLRKQLGESLDRYLTETDRAKIAKRFGTTVYGVGAVLRGERMDNAVMQECQQRALANKERELNAYHPNRVREVVNKLSK